MVLLPGAISCVQAVLLNLYTPTVLEWCAAPTNMLLCLIRHELYLLPPLEQRQPCTEKNGDDFIVGNRTVLTVRIQESNW
jgi:hypothetical protein